MTLAARKPQTIDAASGETVFILVTVTDEAGSVVDLTGFTGKFVMLAADGTVLASSEESPQSAVIDWPDRSLGQVRIQIDPDITDPLVGTYRWELQLTNSAGVKGRAAFGYINLPENLIAA